MTAPRSRWIGLAALAVALVNGLIFYRVVLASGFDAVPGDLGDGRFNLAVLEHWYRVALGAEPWMSPNWYHPTLGTLGYSDALALLAPPYVLARLVGLATVPALAAALASASALGFAGMVLALRGALGLVWPAALAGAAAFAAGSALFQSLAVGHVQMMAVEAVPWLGVFTLLYVRDGRAVWSVAAALTVAALLSTSFYVGWFVCVGLLVTGGLTMATGGGAARGWLIGHWRSLAAAAAALVVALIPFARLYGPAALHSPPRPWDEVARTLPGFAQLLEPRGNALWEPVAAALWPEAVGHGGELGKGLTWGLLAVFAATLAWLALRPPPSIPVGTRRLALILGAAVAVCWALMIQEDGRTAWALVYSWVPGGHGIRSVFRFNLVLAFPVALVAAIGLHGAWEAAGRRGRVGVIAVAALIMAEQINLTPTVLSRSRDFAAIEALPPPPAACRSFVLLETAPAPDYHRWSRQMTAVMIAQAKGLPTVNGYSGMAPAGWALFDPTDPVAYGRALTAWADAHDLWDGLCRVDPGAGRWFPVRRGDVP